MSRLQSLYQKYYGDRLSRLSEATDAAEQRATHEETENMLATEILFMVFLLMIAISSGHFLKKSGHKYLQEAGLTTIIGMVTGYGL